MKILLINETFEEGGGQERFFLENAEELKKEKHKVFIFSFGKKKEKNPNKLIIKNEQTKILKYLHRFIFDFKCYFQLKKFIKKINPDIIHIHGLLRSTNAILHATNKSRAKVVLSVHNFALICPTIWCVHKYSLKVCTGGIGIKCHKYCLHKSLFDKFMFLAFSIHMPYRNKLIKKIVDLYVCGTNAVKSKSEKFGFKNTVLIPYYTNIKKDKNQYEKKIDLLYVGRLEREKGVIILLKSLKKLKEEKTELKVKIVGYGEEENKLKEYVKENKLTNISFEGKKSFDEVENYYKQAKMIVVPSIYMEQFGLIGLEAMSKGVPAIGSNIGGIPEWCKDNKTGLLFEPGNVKELSKKIRLLLTNKQLYAKLSENSLKEIANFNRKEHIKQLLKKYHQLLK